MNQIVDLNMKRVNPILKWAGGKRQILPYLLQYIPKEFNNYYEPFAGGLALLTELYNHPHSNRVSAESF